MDGNTNILGYSDASTKAEYSVMANATCELVWLRNLLQELKFL